MLEDLLKISPRPLEPVVTEPKRNKKTEAYRKQRRKKNRTARAARRAQRR
jgi:hypothetical protein